MALSTLVASPEAQQLLDKSSFLIFFSTCDVELSLKFSPTSAVVLLYSLHFRESSQHLVASPEAEQLLDKSWVSYFSQHVMLSSV